MSHRRCCALVFYSLSSFFMLRVKTVQAASLLNRGESLEIIAIEEQYKTHLDLCQRSNSRICSEWIGFRGSSQSLGECVVFLRYNIG